MTKKMVSPSRQYVAILNKSNFDGYRFRRFELPETAPSYMGFRPMLNNADQAAWYFLNVLDHISCLENCCPLEDFGDAGQYLERQMNYAEKMERYNQIWRAAQRDDAEGPVQP